MKTRLATNINGYPLRLTWFQVIEIPVKKSGPGFSVFSVSRQKVVLSTQPFYGFGGGGGSIWQKITQKYHFREKANPKNEI